MSGRSESCSHKLDDLFGIGKRLSGIVFKELCDWHARGKGVRIASRDVVAVQPGAGVLNGCRYRSMSPDRPTEIIQVVSWLAVTEMLERCFEGFLGGLLAGEAAPGPMAAGQQVAGCCQLT